MSRDRVSRSAVPSAVSMDALDTDGEYLFDTDVVLCDAEDPTQSPVAVAEVLELRSLGAVVRRCLRWWIVIEHDPSLDRVVVRRPNPGEITDAYRN